MTIITDPSAAIALALADLAQTAPDLGVSEAMFWLMVRMEADSNINQLKQEDVCT
tara:strand:+ start:413 stop:577 length:165 start_codon:yes stop_codon:yes gene_type:complete